MPAPVLCVSCWKVRPTPGVPVRAELEKAAVPLPPTLEATPAPAAVPPLIAVVKPVTLELPAASVPDMMNPQPMPTLQPPAMLLLTGAPATAEASPAAERETTLAEPPEPACAPVLDEE